MINNVLDFSRIEKNLKKYVFEKTDLNQIINIVLQLMSYELLMKKFKVEKDLCEGSIFVNGDRDALNSMLANLISNSVKYSESERYLKITTSVKDDMAELIIEDRGTGISEKNLKDIFNPYFRESSTESKKIKGAGLGLSIVKNIVDSHNGKIEVKSESGKGTDFKINFPLYETEKSNITC
ncbi:MAG: HAMP domain-containing sensor histidine kinase [Ignavibacteria bacterium]